MKFDPTTAQPAEQFDPTSAVPEEAPPVRAVLSTAVKQNPDQAARAAALGKQYGVPTDVVVRNLQSVELQAAVDAADERLKTSPKLAAALRTRPEIAPLAHDDIGRLTDVEQAVRKYGEWKAWNGPEPTVKNIALGLAKAVPQAGRAIKAGLDAQMSDFLEWAGLITLDPVTKADRARKLAQASGAADFTRPDFETDTARAIYGGAESFLRMIPGLAASIATRSPTPVLAAAGVQTQGEAYAKYKTRGATGTEAFIGATGEAAVEVATELLPAEFLTSRLGKAGVSEFISGLLIREIPGEQVATLLQDAIDTAVANPDKTWGEYLAERPAAAYSTLVSTLTQSALMGGVHTAARRLAQMGDQGQQANDASDALAEQLKAAGASALRERSPEQFRALMGEMTDGKVYVDGEVLNQLPEDVKAALPQAVQDQIATAAATGDVVEIPVADVLTVAPGTALEEVLVEHARTDPFAMSKADAAEATKLAQSQVMADAQRVIQQAEDADARRAEYDAIHKLYVDQLNAAARFRPAVNEAKAHWLASFYTTMAARTGMTPAEFQAAHPVRILGEASSAGQQVMDTAQLGQAKTGEITVEGYHFSKEDRPTITTAAYGTGLQGSGREMFLNAEDQRLRKRSYFYADKGTGIRPESGVGGRAHRVQLTNVYDSNADPLSLKKGGGGQLGFESRVLDAGFSGYLDRLEGTQPGQVIMLGDQTFRPELLGAQSMIETGKRVPAMPRAEPKWENYATGDAASLQAQMERLQSKSSWADYDFRVEGNALQYRKKQVLDQGLAGFERFVGDATRVDLGDAHEFKAGEAVVVAALHGTTGDFTTFDARMANIESDLGGGFYFTNNPADVGENYAGMGPDLTNKIQGEAERLESNDDLGPDEAMKIARDKWMANEGLTMPVWVKMVNPVVLGGPRETFLAYEESYDEETDEYGEPTGDLVKVIEALRDVASDDRYGDADIEQTIGELMEKAMDNDGLSARELIATAKLSEGLVYATDYEADGKLAPQEILRRAFEAAGFDGFIDQTVDEKFGSQSEGQRKYGNGMKGMGADTVHFIAFKPTQIKSRLGNRGTFDETRSNILEQQAGDLTDGQAGNRGGRYSSGSLAPLEGAPAVAGAAGPDPRLVAVAERYAADNGIPLRRQAAYAVVDPERAARIAAAYEAMPHAPNDPAVREAYENLIRQTVAQYLALTQAGYKFWFMDPAADPYQGNPWNAMRDLRANQSMAVFPTEAGFGTGGQVNIGLADPNGGPNIPPEAVLEALRIVGAEVEASAIFDSDTEPTLVVKLKKALTKEQGDFLSGLADQEAIAQRTDDDKGALFGPMAEKWGPFNPTYFVTPTGVRADEIANPLLQDTGITWPYGSPDGEQRPVLANDLFRAVHDAFGHGLEGAGFRAQGEENAWQAHVRLFTGSAVGAITSETRGQNSWLNYGPHGEKNQTAKVEDTVFADQKTGLMPEWTWTEGRVEDEQGVLEQRVDQAETPEFKRWFGGSKVVDAEGKPLVVYHGTDKDFSAFNPDNIGDNFGVDNEGFFFTGSTIRASGYADPKSEFAAAGMGVQKGDEPRSGANVMPVYLSIQNPLTLDAYTDAFYTNPGVEIDEQGISLTDYFDDNRDSIMDFVKKGRHDGVLFQRKGKTLAVALRPEQIKSAIGNDGTFDANDPSILSQQAQTPRGTFNPATLELVLNPNANLSTFFHETGHFFLEVLADVASQPNAPAQIVEDMNTFLKWAGIADLQTWNSLDLEGKRASHERWAESIEQYVMEGKAPSVELQPLMRRFAAWLKSVYGSIKQFLAARGQAAPGGDTLGQSSKLANDKTIYWHGSVSMDLRGGKEGLHLGTKLAATQALEARIGVPAEGEWDGTREYGKTLLAGRKTLERLEKERGHYLRTGLNAGGPNSPVPDDDYYPTPGHLKYADGTPVPMTMRPDIKPFRLKTEMSNSRSNPYEDFKANGYMRGALKKGNAKRGYYYGNTAEDEGSVSVVVPNGDHVEPVDTETLAQDPNAQLGPPMALNDDIRRVMDRLLATDEQIAQANEVAGLVPDEAADAAAAERLAKRSVADLKWSVRARDQVIAKLRKQAAAIEKDIREQVTVEVDQTPEMRAKRALDALSVSPEYAGMLAEHKAARKAAEVAVRDEVKAALLATNPEAKGLIKGQLLAKNKRDIDNKVDAAMIKWDQENPAPKRPVNATDADVATIADSFGFESVDAMMQAIDAFGSRREAIDGLTEKRMLEEHGDLIDERAISEAANEAVHNEARARSLATELRTQREMLNPRQDTGETNARGAKVTVNALVEAAKQFATNVIGRTALRDLTARAWQHTAAERRAAARWQQATAAGKTEEAVKAKQDQMLNHAAAKAAIDAKAEAKKILDFFRRVTKGNDETVVEKGRDADIVNAARAVLAAYGVQSPTTKAAADYLETLQRDDPETYNVVLPMIEGATRNAQPLDALTFDELKALEEEIQAMWFLAKRSRQMEVDGDLLDVQDVADEVYARLEEIGIPDTIPGETGALTEREIQARRWLQQVPALLRRVEQWAEAKDGKFGGPFSRFIFGPVKTAADAYRADRLEYRKRFQALVDNIAPMMPAKTIAAPELGYVFGRGHNGIGMAELLHAIAHTGNESNKRKLLLGRGWATENADGTLDTGKWDAFIQRLAADGTLQREHYDFVQGIWGLMEQTKPLAQKTHREVFGRYFAEVTADAFVDPFGVSRSGGYIPAQADPLLVQDADLRELLETDNAGMSQAFPATNRGFTKSRVEYNRPLKLDLRTLPQHIDKVLLFSHMEPAVRGVARLLRQPKVAQPLARVDPAAMGGMLKPWLNRSARQTVETPVSADAGLNRVMSTIRARVGMALMFANVSNTLQQITGFASAATKVKPALMRRAAAQFIASPKRFKDAVWAMSPYMADRASNEVAALSDTMEKILINPGVFARAESWTRQHAYFLQTAMDNVMSPIIWTGAYNQGIAEGMDERMAIRFADGVIRQTQGSTLPEDVSRIETGPAYARVFTQFIGYFNMLANTNATALQQIAQEQGLKKGAGKAFGVVMLGLLAPIWVAEAIAHAMRGGPDDEDDDGYLDDWLAAVFGFGTIRGILAGVPFIGAAAQSAVNRFNDQPADDKFSLSPTVSVLESAVGAPASVYGAIVDDKSAQKAIRDVSALITVATGLPAMAAARPLGYAAGVAQGKIDPTGPVDAARGAITGTASPDSKQR